MTQESGTLGNNHVEEIVDPPLEQQPTKGEFIKCMLCERKDWDRRGFQYIE